MRLRTKLLILSFVLISVPALIVVLVTGAELVKREQDLKLLTLRSVKLDLERELGNFESDFSKDAVMVANLDDVKEYLGSSSSGITSEKLGLKLENLVLRSQVDSLALYRYERSDCYRALIIGDNRAIPSTVGVSQGQGEGDRVKYQTEASEMRVTTVFPVSLYGRVVGIVYLRRVFDFGWFEAFAYAHSVDLGIHDRGNFIFSNSGVFGDIPASYFVKRDLEAFRFASGKGKYLGISTPLFPSLGGTATAIFAIKNEELLIEDKRTTLVLIGVILFCIMFPAIVLNFVGLRIIGSLSSVAAAAGSLARGDLAYRIASKRDDEIGDLYESFNRMALQLEVKEASVNERNRKLALLNAYIGAVFQDLLVSCIAVESDGKVALANESAGVELQYPRGLGRLEPLRHPLLHAPQGRRGGASLDTSGISSVGRSKARARRRQGRRYGQVVYLGCLPGPVGRRVRRGYHRRRRYLGAARPRGCARPQREARGRGTSCVGLGSRYLQSHERPPLPYPAAIDQAASGGRGLAIPLEDGAGGPPHYTPVRAPPGHRQGRRLPGGMDRSEYHHPRNDRRLRHQSSAIAGSRLRSSRRSNP